MDATLKKYAVRCPTDTNTEKNTPAELWPLSGVVEAENNRQAAALAVAESGDLQMVNAGSGWVIFRTPTGHALRVSRIQ